MTTARLFVAAIPPVAVLDQVGTGKMTLEEFAKKATIETVTK